jgi:uncharacterized protein YukE
MEIKQSSIEWLEKELLKNGYVNKGYHNQDSLNHLENLFIQAKEMEEKQNFEFWQGGINSTEEGEKSFDQYYNKEIEHNLEKIISQAHTKTIRKKGKDYAPSSNEIQKEIDAVSSQTKMSNESWEGCDGCTEQDEIMYKNGYVKGYNAAISELPKEISDEEIVKLTNEHILYNDSKRQWVIEGMKLYRKQLKVKI